MQLSSLGIGVNLAQVIDLPEEDHWAEEYSIFHSKGKIIWIQREAALKIQEER